MGLVTAVLLGYWFAISHEGFVVCIRARRARPEHAQLSFVREQSPIRLPCVSRSRQLAACLFEEREFGACDDRLPLLPRRLA